MPKIYPNSLGHDKINLDREQLPKRTKKNCRYGVSSTVNVDSKEKDKSFFSSVRQCLTISLIMIVFQEIKQNIGGQASEVRSLAW